MGNRVPIGEEIVCSVPGLSMSLLFAQTCGLLLME